MTEKELRNELMKKYIDTYQEEIEDCLEAKYNLTPDTLENEMNRLIEEAKRHITLLILALGVQ